MNSIKFHKNTPSDEWCNTYKNECRKNILKNVSFVKLKKEN